MARPREFEEDAVLSGAAKVFRRHGFGAVSIKELETATGLKAGSIYNTYGDKEGLFQAAMAHYNHSVLGGRITEYAPEQAGLAGLRSLFRHHRQTTGVKKANPHRFRHYADIRTMPI